MSYKVVLLVTMLVCFANYSPTHSEDGLYDDDRTASALTFLQPHSGSEDFVLNERKMLEKGHQFPLWMDVQALLSFKKDINDPSGKLSNWTTENSKEVCSWWYGITCRKHNPRVVAIILPGLNLTGEIPEGIGSLVLLSVLNLSWNQLEGKISVSLHTLSTLEQLDLAKNNLSGEIPPELSELLWLDSVNFSFNNLCGSIPAQFSTFSEASYQRNKCLCGYPLQECKKNASKKNPSKKNNTRSIGGWLHYMDKKMSLIALGIGVVIGFGGVVMVFIAWKKARDWVVPPNRPKRFYGEYRLPT